MATDLKNRVAARNGGSPAPAPRAAEPAEMFLQDLNGPHMVPVQIALARVMRDVKSVGKDGYHNAPGAKFNYRGIDGVLNAVGPALRAHGVIVMPELQEVAYRDVQTSTGKPARETTVRVKYTFVGPDGTTLSVVTPGEAMDHGDKGTAKAMSVAFRVALIQALALPTDEPDPDAYHYERDSAYVGQEDDPIVEATSELLNLCVDSKWAPKVVNVAFHAQYGHNINEATDPQEITAFVAELREHHAEMLPAAEKALADAEAKKAEEKAVAELNKGGLTVVKDDPKEVEPE